MTNELPDKFASQMDGDVNTPEMDEDLAKADLKENDGNESAEDRDRRDGSGDSHGSDVRYRPRTRYPRRRLTGSSRNRSREQDDSRDLPLRQRMKIYRNRRPSR